MSALLGGVSFADNPSFHNAPDSAKQLKNPYEGSDQVVAEGQPLYQRRCARCHGNRGEGVSYFPPLRGRLDSVTSGEVFWFITKGNAKKGMPSWARLPEQQRWKIVSYVRALSGGKIADTAPPSTSKEIARLNRPRTKPPFIDFRDEEPGKSRKITVADLPQPYATRSADNDAQMVARPADVRPQAPAGFKVEIYAAGLDNPRRIRRAPNSDMFVAESEPGRIRVFRGITADGKPEQMQVFASGLRRPYGIAFYPPGPNPQWLYIGDENELVRFAYKNGDMTASGQPQHILDLPVAGHWTRDLQFSADGKKLYVAVGSRSNVDDPDTNAEERNRADILEFNPDGSGMRVYAYGIRNAGGGLGVNPQTGELWCSVNERDGLGDNLVPDYITHVQDGGFYGWPWWYMGAHQDPRHKGKHPELKDKAIVPDVLLQPHSASLGFTFYDGKQFPDEYSGDIFAAEHGSWNKSVRAGYEVIRVPLHQAGHASHEYQDFLTGFVLPNGDVWGRPVGVAVASDGSLLVTDDGSNSIWRVSHQKR